ncbi:MAG: response regulator [Flavobacterium sp.]
MKFKNVYVVDDDEVFHFLVKKMLSANDIEVKPSFFKNGFDALTDLKNKLKLDNGLPDVILLDLNMPVLDGWQFLEEFKSLKDSLMKNIAVYIISSSDNVMDRERADGFSEEISGYFLKPVTVESIKSIFK